MYESVFLATWVMTEEKTLNRARSAEEFAFRTMEDNVFEDPCSTPWLGMHILSKSIRMLPYMLFIAWLEW